MSNEYPQGYGFVLISKEVIKSGLFAGLAPSAKAMYIVLNYKMEYSSNRKIRISDEQIKELAGISLRSIRDVRIELQEAGLFRYEKQDEKPHSYELLDPSTKQPFVEPPSHEKRQSTFQRDNKVQQNTINTRVSAQLNSHVQVTDRAMDAKAVGFN